MTEETKKTLVYGGVISLAVGVALYIYTRAAGGGADGGAAAQAAQQAQAAQDETNLAMLAELGSSGASFGGGGFSLNSETTGSPEKPHDNFAQEIAAILNATGLGGSASAAGSPAPPASTAPALPQPVVSHTQPAFATVPNHNNVLYARKVLA